MPSLLAELLLINLVRGLLNVVAAQPSSAWFARLHHRCTLRYVSDCCSASLLRVAAKNILVDVNFRRLKEAKPEWLPNGAVCDSA